ncbi:MAG TPA: insulinase family protein, partial [Pyrinomonadaceae bacterium]|nr:insulinase family protein [Pyrinomonadaceae bacterium]
MKLILIMTKINMFRRFRAASLTLLFAASFLAAGSQVAIKAQAAQTSSFDNQWSAKSLATVTEFEVNGLKVLVKRREGSSTVAAGLFLRGGSRNLTAANAGIEALMLDTATEASVSFPRERMRIEQSRLGTLVSYGVNYDYSVLTFASTRQNFDQSWGMFTDVALRPAFDAEDFDRVKNRLIISTRDDTDAPDSHLQMLSDKLSYANH